MILLAMREDASFFEWEYKKAGGQPFYVDVMLTRLKMGSVVFLQVAMHDITRRKQAEAELRIAAAAFEAQEGMLITDANGVILRINRTFTRITGYTAEEAVGQTPRLLKSGRHDPAFYAEMWKSVHNTGAWEGEIWNRRKNGDIYPESLAITAVKNHDGTIAHYVAIFKDATMSKTATDEIKSLAFYDPLTKLPNRRLFLDRFNQALSASARNHHYGAMLFIDMDC